MAPTRMHPGRRLSMQRSWRAAVGSGGAERRWNWRLIGLRCRRSRRNLALRRDGLAELRTGRLNTRRLLLRSLRRLNGPIPLGGGERGTDIALASLIWGPLIWGPLICPSLIRAPLI